MIIRFKRLNERAVMPTKAHATDAGFDLVATSKTTDEYDNIVYGTGLALEIPFGYVGLIFPRSSNAKKDLLLSNSVGVIDSGYRGEIMFKFKPSWRETGSVWEPSCYNKRVEQNDYKIGDRIGQIIIMPLLDIEFAESDNLSETDRGEGGYGSSGN